jgi:hypothetical protein
LKQKSAINIGVSNDEGGVDWGEAEGPEQQLIKEDKVELGEQTDARLLI